MRTSSVSLPRLGLFRSTVLLFAVAVLAAALVGCTAAPGDDAASETINSSDNPALATVPITGVVVGFVGTGMVVENHSNQNLKRVEIVVNEGGAQGGFHFHIDEMGPRTTNTYLTQVFRTPEGQSLDPDAVKVEKFSLYADTPQGRGVWRGAY